MKKRRIIYTPRSLARSVARANMQAAGIEHVNRRFDRWREWVFQSKSKKLRPTGGKLYEIGKNGKPVELCDARFE